MTSFRPSRRLLCSSCDRWTVHIQSGRSWVCRQSRDLLADALPRSPETAALRAQIRAYQRAQRERAT